MDARENNRKVGNLIKEIRRQRGLSQAELAKMMGTSQSAINRIEKGNQNLSLDTIYRFGDALQQSIIKINSDNVSLKIKGGLQLKGEATIHSAKNNTLALMMAAMLNRGKTVLKNASKIEEVYRISEVLESIGVGIKWFDRDLEIRRPAKLDLGQIDKKAANKTRSVVMLIGSLVHEFSRFEIPMSGGCKLGDRSVTSHIYALEHFGIDVKINSNHYQVNAKLRQPESAVIMYESGDTPTINALIAASYIPETTVIKMASANYQVQDVCVFLRQLGVDIKGIGTTTLTVKGLKKKINKNITYHVSEDPIEAMNLIAATITTNSEVTLRRVPIEFLELELYQLSKMGLKFEILNKYLAANDFTSLVDLKIHRHNGKLTSPEIKITPRPFPGLNIDNLPYFVPIAASAKGQTLIHDWVYEDRAIYYTELNRIGAQVELADRHRVYVRGPTQWQPANMSCPPAIRPATINLIAMLAAKGVSILRNIYTINRGYEDIAKRYNDLGADVEVITDINV